MSRLDVSGSPVRAVVVVPTFNEAESIRALIPAIHEAAPEIDVLVVDDDSPDGTARIVEAMAARDRRVRALVRRGARGFAGAYVAGFKDALARGYDVIGQMDCDLQHPPRYLRELFAATAAYDAVIGSRYLAGARTGAGWPLHRRLVSRGGNAYARWVLGLPLHDLTGGFKCWRRSALLAIDLDAVMASGFAFQMEMNYRARRKGLRIGEIPIVFPHREAGTSKMRMREFWESLAMPWRLRLAVP